MFYRRYLQESGNMGNNDMRPIRDVVSNPQTLLEKFVAFGYRTFFTLTVPFWWVLDFLWPSIEWPHEWVMERPTQPPVADVGLWFQEVFNFSAETNAWLDETFVPSRGKSGGVSLLGGLMSVLTAIRAESAVLTQELMLARAPEKMLNRPDAGRLAAMGFRFPEIDGALHQYFLDLGFPPVLEPAFKGTQRPRPALPHLIELYQRYPEMRQYVKGEMGKQGYEAGDVDRVLTLARQYVPPADLLKGWLRGAATEGKLVGDLAAQGLTQSDIGLLKDLTQIIPGPQDLIHMAVREAWDDGVAAKWGYDAHFPPEFGEWASKQGLDRSWAEKYWRSHWILPSPMLGYDMLHRGIIDTSELDELLRIADYPAGWRDKMIDVAYKPYTRVDVRRMYKVGVLDREDVYRAYLDLGYNAEKAEGMTVFTEVYSPPEDATPEDEYKAISRSIVERAYKLGKLTRGEATTRLMDLGYTGEDIELLLSLVDGVKELDEAPDSLAEFRRDMKAIIERAFERRVLSPEEALDMLVDLGYSGNEAEFILLAVNAIYQQKTTETRLSIIGKAYVLRAISRTRVFELLGHLNLAAAEQAQIIAEWDVEREIRDRPLTESQYRKYLTTKIKQIDGWLSAGDITEEKRGIMLADLIDEYSENLRGLGYTEKAIGILVFLAVPEGR